MGFTYVEKKAPALPKNCSIAIPRDLSAKGKSSMRYAEARTLSVQYLVNNGLGKKTGRTVC